MENMWQHLEVDSRTRLTVSASTYFYLTVEKGVCHLLEEFKGLFHKALWLAGGGWPFGTSEVSASSG